MEGEAARTGMPFSSNIALSLPQADPATTASPMRSVPFCTSRVAITPRDLSTVASSTVPIPGLLGLARISACSEISVRASSRSARPVLRCADTGMTMVLPPHSSGVRPASLSCCFTSSGLALARSILLSATMMGTCAFFACAIASRVWGITPSSAATTSTTISVVCAPRARMAVKAA